MEKKINFIIKTILKIPKELKKKLVEFVFEEVEKLNKSKRGLDGLGSTGK